MNSEPRSVKHSLGSFPYFSLFTVLYSYYCWHLTSTRHQHWSKKENSSSLLISSWTNSFNKQGNEWKRNASPLEPKPGRHILCNRKPPLANIQHIFDGFTAHFINKKKGDTNGLANKVCTHKLIRHFRYQFNANRLANKVGTHKLIRDLCYQFNANGLANKVGTYNYIS